MDNVKRRLPPPQIEAAKPIELRIRGDFLEWLAQSGGTLAATTYNSGKLALLSAPQGELVASYWRFPRPMGVCFAESSLALVSHAHVWVFRVRTAEGALTIENVFDTGRVDAHDLAFDHRGLAFANTRFNCIARPSDRVSFLRVWEPPFIATRRRKDCCHLNGLGVRDGRVAMASAFCASDEPAAWRGADRFQSGVLIDVRRGAIVARGLCMPHSPRWHDGRWWFCDSGRGALCRVHQTNAPAAEEVAALPGFTRGLTFAAGRAVVGLSRIRKRHILDAPPVRERFARLRSGLWLVDPRDGRTTGSIEFVRGGREVYDVACLPGIQRPVFPPSPGEPQP